MKKGEKPKIEKWKDGSLRYMGRKIVNIATTNEGEVYAYKRTGKLVVFKNARIINPDNN